jgi:hypothetical protein
MAGVEGRTIEVEGPATLEGAMIALARRLRSAGAEALLSGEGVHPSVLVVVDGVARPARDRGFPLTGKERIELLLPIAGG